MRSTVAGSSFTRFFMFVATMAVLGVSACGGDGTEPADDPTGALNATTCAQVAKAGNVDICHTSASEPGFKALTVSQRACSVEHATHLEDFVASAESGCKQAKPAAQCKRSGSPCSFSRPTECCSLSCILLGKKPACG